MKRTTTAWRMAMIGLTAGLFLRAPVEAAAPDYLRDIKPILAANCYKCHGALQQKSGLRLDTAAFARQGGDHGPAIVAKAATQSLLIQVVAGAHAEIPRMPYKKAPLTEEQIALLRAWIEAGAEAPANEPPESRPHWAFVPPIRSPAPGVRQLRGSVRNAIDSFVVARLEQNGIAPSPEADGSTLLRRVYLDLLGLPPTPAEVGEFLNDRRPDAYERLIDRLLASAHYGERWGRWWLDVARYADSNGYSIDAPRSIWKYRDWVIQAFNRDLPFDEFVVEQLGGDLLPGATVDQKIATGFHRNTQINQEGGIDPEQFRVESVVDRVNTTATAFLGVTLACAQCHDHKFDPFTQREYYQMFAFFNSTVEEGHGKGTPGGMLEVPNEFEGGENLPKEIEEAEDELERYLNTKGKAQQDWEDGLTLEESGRLRAEVQKILQIPFADRTPKQKRMAYAAFKPEDSEFKSRNNRLSKLERREPKPVTTLVMRELEMPRETHVLIKGDFTRPGAIVPPGVPAVLPPLAGTSPTNRLALARWIVSTNHPLTARVAVNRVWQQYFGRGLVETENDFGTQGAPPSHPELLDWLACELMEPAPTNKAWSLKHLHRLIVTSATYRQSSHVRPDLREQDPNNKLFARQTRLRLDAEVVRDVALEVSGLFSPKMGGPPVFPPQPAGVMTLGQSKRDWKPSTGNDRFRRGIYTWFWRATPHPALAVFDAPDAFSACTRRLRSNTPLQALTLLNDQQFYEMAEGLAARIVREGPATDAGRVDYAFRVCLARRPRVEEARRLLELKQAEAALDARQAWTAVARVLLNLDETVTRE